MHKKLSLLMAGSLAGLALTINALRAADAPAAAAGGNATAAAPAASGNATAAPAIDLSKLPKASDKKDLTFAKDIEPLFKASCAGCHYMPQRPSGGLDLSTLASTLKGGRKGKDVVPGKSTESLVLLYAAGVVPKAEMPPLAKRDAAHPALTSEQLGVIRAWIDQGAK